MQVGIELASAALGCGLAAGMSWLAIEGLFRLAFLGQGGAGVAPSAQGRLESTSPRPPVASR